ncbi:hypothetical protein MMC16_002244 [Acarospora aff. strigata]|nr:hypothetical protein [Acarospora aff. strigata]
MALILAMQANNVYPQLLLARLLFSLGGAATSTMVTAILPSMTARAGMTSPSATSAGLGHAISPSVASELTITPARFRGPRAAVAKSEDTIPASSSPARLAGLVGMFTGCGALLALGVFLPLPARLQKAGVPPAQAIKDSYYVVGVIALLLSLFCYFGLRRLNGEEGKGWKAIYRQEATRNDETHHEISPLSYWRLFLDSVSLGLQKNQVGLAYTGGFVARASSVGISLFIPLYVNTYFVSSGLCKLDPADGTEEMRHQCRRAYILAAELTGVSQLTALLCAPVFGYLSGRYQRFNIPLLVAALVGVAGYMAFALLGSPEPSGQHGSPAVFFIVALLGLSQIGAIVCSLGLLGNGIIGGGDDEDFKGSNGSQQLGIDREEDGLDSRNNRSRPAGDNISSSRDRRRLDHGDSDETSTLLGSRRQRGDSSLKHLKGSMAGVYSLAGGAGILILTKLGGILFDRLSTSAPFYMLAAFNGLLFLVGIGCNVTEVFETHQGKR